MRNLKSNLRRRVIPLASWTWAPARGYVGLKGSPEEGKCTSELSWHLLGSSFSRRMVQSFEEKWSWVMLGHVDPGKDNTLVFRRMWTCSQKAGPMRGLLKGLLLNATAKLGKNQEISERICVVVLFCFIVVLLLLLQIILCIPFTTLLFSCWPGTHAWSWAGDTVCPTPGSLKGLKHPPNFWVILHRSTRLTQAGSEALKFS